MRTLFHLVTFGCASLLQAQDASTYPSAVVNAYYKLGKPLVTTTPEMAPPSAARAFGYMGVALYESVVPGMPGQASLQTQLPELGPLFAVIPGQQYHWPSAASHALCLMMDSLFFNMTPQLRADLYAIRDTYDAQFAGDASLTVILRSQAFGEAIAQGVLNMARTDGGHRAQLANYDPLYVPPTGPGMWIPEGGQDPLLPHWGGNRPFLEGDTMFSAAAPPPPTFSTTPGDLCYDAAYDVYLAATNITTAQLTTVSYWADGQLTPGGHSIQMMEQLMRRGGKDLASAVRGYAMLGMALSDAFLSCWRTKYLYTWQRPRNYINQYIDPNWNTWIPTPPFPDYTSGHATQAGAWASIMSEVFGDPVAFTDSTHGALHGGPRTFADFWTAAQQVGESRFLAGIHFNYSNQEGLLAGSSVADNIITLFQGLYTDVPEQQLPALPVQVTQQHDRFVVNGVAGSWTVHDALGRTLLNGRGSGSFQAPNGPTGWCILRAAEGSARWVVIP